MTDRVTVTEGVVPQVTQDFPFRVTVPCAATVDSTIGSTCVIGTSADAVLPGAAPEGVRSLWQIAQLRVNDSGADGNVSTTGDNMPFVKQGIFVP